MLDQITLGDASQLLLTFGAVVAAVTALAMSLRKVFDNRVKELFKELSKMQDQVAPVVNQFNGRGFTDLKVKVDDLARNVDKLVTLAEVQGRRQDRSDARMDSHLKGHQ